jgi:hypothetical protein
MAVHCPLNAFSFDISLIEIGQEIKLLEHLKEKLDHPVFLLSHLHPAARQFCRSTYTITDNTIK